jgi:hypothetical protein
MPITINGSTGISGVDGSASTPALQGTDTNTGMFFPSADTIAFAEGGTEVARFDSSGNLGIGTSSPTNGRLVITGSSVTTAQGIRLTGDTADARFICESATLGAGILGTFSNHSQLFYTNSAERARIDSSGRVLINTTTADTNYRVRIEGASATGSPLRCSMDSTSSVTQVGFFNPNGAVGSISTSGSATAYNTSSDYRLKESITPMTGALAKVSLLKPVTYKWKVDGSDGQGFIAHELAEVEAGCVNGEKDAVDADGNPVYQGIDTSFLVATLTAAIQELNAKVEAQAAEIAALKGAQA